MTSVLVFKSGRNNTTKFKVYYNKKEMTYTTESVPNTVLKFIQTHNFKKLDNGMIFK